MILLAAGCTFNDRIHGQRLPEYIEKTDAKNGATLGAEFVPGGIIGHNSKKEKE